MEILGYLSAALIGLSLGLLGAGGSILTLPVLVYLFRIEPVAAVRYSLFVVGITSLVACIPRIKKGEVLFIQGSLFALISIIIVYLTRTWLIPFMPHDIFQSGNLVVSFGAASMIAFAILTLLASRMMIRSPKQQITANKSPSELI
ncbi:MAG: sulfite exporter TauE/SafE family protein, partial [Pedobacter sp.]